MSLQRRIKEAANKLIFCYTNTENFSSFMKIIWYTKLYSLRKKSTKLTKNQSKFFTICLKAFPGKKIFLRVYAGDIDIFYEIFYKKIYELPFSLDEQVIIDAGANVGFATLYFLSRMPDATIYCIEPDPDNFFFLEKNLQDYISSGKAIPVMAGLYGEDGLMSLKRSHLKYNSAISDINDGNSHSVACYSVSVFFKNLNIDKADIFKIDIEGAEENIFRSDVSWLRVVSSVLIEFHSKRIEEICLEKLRAQKFDHIFHNARKNTSVYYFKKHVL